MGKTKDIPDGSVALKQPILSRCPHCAKPNPVIDAKQIAESTDSVMVAFVPECCLKIICCQLIAKAPEPPIIN